MNKQDVFNAAAAACKAMDDKFGKDITALDISGISPLADYFLIVTGLNPPQIAAMSDACGKACAEAGLPLLRSEGAGTGWLLLDFGAVIVHIFDKDQRDFYNLERIWSDAKREDMRANDAGEALAV